MVDERRRRPGLHGRRPVDRPRRAAAASATLLTGHSDVSIGTRLAHSARVARGPEREVISRCYDVLLHSALRVRSSDAQCGFTAIRADLTPPAGSTPPAGGSGRGRTGGGGVGGLLDAGTTDPALVAALQQEAGFYAWAAAAVGSNSAAGPQLASGEPVMAIGGFNGTDPGRTLAQFQAKVAQGEVHYFLGGGSGRGGSRGGSTTTSTSSQITSWVTATFTAEAIGGTTVYDLTSPAG